MHGDPLIPLRILIDGQCSLCAMEARFLMRLDRGRGRLIIEDMTEPGFDAARYGLTMEQAMSGIHAVCADGSVIDRMEVFRRAYGALGLGWLIAWTAWWPARPLVDRLYLWFARNRWRFSKNAGACAVSAEGARGQGSRAQRSA